MNKFKLSLLCLLGDYFFLKLFKFQCSIFNMLSNLILRFTFFLFTEIAWLSQRRIRTQQKSTHHLLSVKSHQPSGMFSPRFKPLHKIRKEFGLLPWLTKYIEITCYLASQKELDLYTQLINQPWALVVLWSFHHRIIHRIFYF